MWWYFCFNFKQTKKMHGLTSVWWIMINERTSLNKKYSFGIKIWLLKGDNGKWSVGFCISFFFVAHSILDLIFDLTIELLYTSVIEIKLSFRCFSHFNKEKEIYLGCCSYITSQSISPPHREIRRSKIVFF